MCASSRGERSHRRRAFRRAGPTGPPSPSTTRSDSAGAGAGFRMPPPPPTVTTTTPRQGAGGCRFGPASCLPAAFPYSAPSPPPPPGPPAPGCGDTPGPEGHAPAHSHHQPAHPPTPRPPAPPARPEAQRRWERPGGAASAPRGARTTRRRRRGGARGRAVRRRPFGATPPARSSGSSQPRPPSRPHPEGFNLISRPWPPPSPPAHDPPLRQCSPPSRLSEAGGVPARRGRVGRGRACHPHDCRPLQSATRPAAASAGRPHNPNLGRRSAGRVGVW